MRWDSFTSFFCPPPEDGPPHWKPSDQGSMRAMSLRAPSVIGLVGVLQQHGLSYTHLAAFVAACRARHNGPVLFRLSQGRIQALEVQASERSKRLQHD